MIQPLETAVHRIEKVQTEMSSMVRESLMKLEQLIIILNVQQQTESGVYSTGKEMPGPYADFTIQKKEEKGQRTDVITLEDTGDFHEAFTVEYKEDKLIIYSTDWKMGMLMKEWGKDIFGLTEENKIVVSKEMLTYLPAMIKEKLHGND